jgi:hypothetical protein
MFHGVKLLIVSAVKRTFQLKMRCEIIKNLTTLTCEKAAVAQFAVTDSIAADLLGREKAQ